MMHHALHSFAKYLLTVKTCLAAVAVLYSLTSLADTNPTQEGQLIIGGTVYGGGSKAAINTDNARLNGEVLTSSDIIADQQLQNLSSAVHTQTASEVNIYSGTVGNVFGGGAMGRSFGTTTVTLDGADVLVENNVFGAGEGTGAAVLGGTLVTMNNGTVNGGIYGGADAARTVGNTVVHILGGSALNVLFGGSRAANIYGCTFVWLDGANALNNIRVSNAFGGSDVTGTITPANAADHPYWTWAYADQLKRPSVTDMPLPTTPDLTVKPTDKSYDDYNAFIYASKPKQGTDLAEGATEKKLVVGNMYVGGNGDYPNAQFPDVDYVNKFLADGTTENPNYRTKPELNKGYVQIEGGVYNSLFGGGNAATISGSTDICLVNSTKLDSYDREYQFGRVFGGNNKEEMKIRPTWFLQQASIQDLYSGGNAGAMTYYVSDGGSGDETGNGGIFLAIESDQMRVHNVYGGCRMADVNPGNLGRGVTELNAETLFEGKSNAYTFQKDYATRVLIAGGDIDNVYGGNDVSGIVYHGSQVEIHSTVHGDVYGGGNGSYNYVDFSGFNAAATDATNGKLTKQQIIDKGLADYVFDPLKVLQSRMPTEYGSLTNLENWHKVRAMNLWRPDARKTYVHLKGQEVAQGGDAVDDKGNPVTNKKITYVGGKVFLGGNSATINTLDNNLTGVSAHLQIGNYVVAKELYLGSNGEDMVTREALKAFKDNCSFSLTDGTVTDGLKPFDRYMRAVEVAIIPTVAFDGFDKNGDALSEYKTYYNFAEDGEVTAKEGTTSPLQDLPYSSFRSGIGSLFLGGNVGSMTSPEQFTYNFDKKISIYRKLVAGCSQANVHIRYEQKEETVDGVTTTVDDLTKPLNTFHQGGLTNVYAEKNGSDYVKNADGSYKQKVDDNGNPLPKVHLELANIRLNPYRLDPTKDRTEHVLIPYYYYDDLTVGSDNHQMTAIEAKTIYGEGSDRVKKDGNIYGGCYTSGYVNGGVQIDITENTLYEEAIYEATNYHPESALDVLSSRLSVYGGGYGLDTEVWGDVTINVSENGQILKVFGGGEEGFVGKIQRDANGQYVKDANNANKYAVVTPYNATVSLYGSEFTPDYTDEAFAYDAMRVYGGGYEGIVTGNTTLNLGRANVHSAFAGACNADIYGYTTLNIGYDPTQEDATGSDVAPTIYNNVYGGNDFGGQIYGSRDITVDNTDLDLSDANTDVPTKIHTQTYVEYKYGHIKGNIYGGSCGAYPYLQRYNMMFTGTPASVMSSTPVVTRLDGKYFSLPSMKTDNYNTYLETAGTLGVNSFVNVISTSTDETDKVEGAIYGAGEGLPGRMGFADEVSSYVRLNSRSDKLTAPMVYGAGYCSVTDWSFVDAFQGKYNQIFGGCCGMTMAENIREGNKAAENLIRAMYIDAYSAAYNTAYTDAYNAAIAAGKSEEDAVAEANVAGDAAGSAAAQGTAATKYQDELNRLYQEAYDAKLAELADNNEMTAPEKEAAAVAAGDAAKAGRPDQALTTRMAYAEVTYMPKHSNVRLHGMSNPEMDLFGAGNASGSEESLVQLFSGQARNVYGASHSEGFTFASMVEVPQKSNTQVNAIFGGAYGTNDANMCDVANTYVAYHSKADVAGGTPATVAEAIYGGNNNARLARNTHLEIDVPVLKDAANDVLANVYGAGMGANTVATYTNVILNDGAQVQNVFGGGFNGRVLDDVFLRAYLAEKTDGEEGANGEYPSGVEVIPYYDAVTNQWTTHEGTKNYYPDIFYEYENAKSGSLFFDIDENFKHVLIADDAAGDGLTNAVVTSLKDANGNPLPTDYTITWPGAVKWRYNPENYAYLQWQDKQKAIYGEGVQLCTVFERGKPSDDNYVPEHEEEYSFPVYWAQGFSRPHFLYTIADNAIYLKQTNVDINEGALVKGNAYGAGEGEKSNVSGTTNIKLLGGTILGDIFGGGLGGDVRPDAYLRMYTDPTTTTTTAAGVVADRVVTRSNVLVGAGTVRNVFGGGENGLVLGFANTVLGAKDAGKDQFKATFKDVVWPKAEKAYIDKRYVSGDPIVLQSVYGGGKNGPVDCINNITINQGHVGYKYDAAANGGAGQYVENLTLGDDTKEVLRANGNVFGGGYGAAASSRFVRMRMFGGTIRNSLYGGGEMASIGVGPTNAKELDAAEVGAMLRNYTGKNEGETHDYADYSPGYTHVVMYNGLVRGDVFGGGRGYSVDAEGGQITAKDYFNDGYVFGKTHVSIRGGIIGTDETLVEETSCENQSQGNVFGGSNAGFLFTAAKKWTGADNEYYKQGRYYTNAWKCDNCGMVVYCYPKPHACWSCAHHTNPNAILDKTSFTRVNTTEATGVYKDFGMSVEAGEEGESYILVLSEDARVVVSPYVQVKTTETSNYVFAEKIENASLEGGELNKASYAPGDYIPTEYISTLDSKVLDASPWEPLRISGDEDGVTIRNAVFAGGNIARGSTQVNADTKTVFGNATATLNDLFFGDLISVGEPGIGGLYGDGNLTLVDGYRELNITNFGTEQENLRETISAEEYAGMNARQKAYYVKKYICKTEFDYEYSVTTDGETNTYTTNYAEGDEINDVVYSNLTDVQKAKVDVKYICDQYAGRSLNTIQRADFCGVVGSRLILRGARDRVPTELDFNDYTINRVGELSLNKSTHLKYKPNLTQGAEQSDEAYENAKKANDFYFHGNFFGMYNKAKYLGSITSDVTMETVRVTGNSSDPNYANKYRGTANSDGTGNAYGIATYWDWKSGRAAEKKVRNNGTSYNKVALASGVALELVHAPAVGESETANGAADALKKNWGYITGVVELDLIDILPGEGGGYVYAKNQHGKRSNAAIGTGKHDNLSVYNRLAVNNTGYTYDDDDRGVLQTSGNFVHGSKTILDDCYPGVDGYTDYEKVAPAHYWYIKGDVYIYNQTISAYTGATSAYTFNTSIPLTITLGSRGRLDLINIQPNLYAYYKPVQGSKEKVPMTKEDAPVLFGSKTYSLNDEITFWDWVNLSDEEQAYFVPVTYVAISDFSYVNASNNEVKVAKGDVFLASEYNDLKNLYTTTRDEEGVAKPFTDFVHISNEVAHNNGYALGVSFDNPEPWNKWYSVNSYSSESQTSKINTDALKAKGEDALDNPGEYGYTSGPTYYLNGTPGVYGQSLYTVGSIIPKSTVNSYEAMGESVINALTDQATFEKTYVCIKDLTYANQEGMHEISAGMGLPASAFNDRAIANLAIGEGEFDTYFEEAMVCTNSLISSASAFAAEDIFYGDLIPVSKYNALKAQYETATGKTDAESEVGKFFELAYYCSEEGKYGGGFYTQNTNYSALAAWAALSADDRSQFAYNFDALDVLHFSGDGTQAHYKIGSETADPRNIAETGLMGNYDGAWTTDPYNMAPIYNATQYVDYQAYLKNPSGNQYYIVKPAEGETNYTATLIPEGNTTTHLINRQQYESIPNEKAHYMALNVSRIGNATEAEDVTTYVVKEQFSQAGQTYYAGQQLNSSQYLALNGSGNNKLSEITLTIPAGSNEATYYYCREEYTIAPAIIPGTEDVKWGTPITPIGGTTQITNGGTVPVCTLISATEFNGLTNMQTGFEIVGDSPQELSTLYVASNPSIDNLTKKRIVTLVYQYQYEESDASGNHVEPVIEKHILNITIDFESGVPDIGRLEEPDIILPNNLASLKQPTVNQGAYEILGAGWEVYKNKGDAENHTNGKPYENNKDPLFWYQDGWYVAYYATTVLGRTYSNSVPFRVANYHDINEVLNHEAYMHIDDPTVKRNSKIYIDDRDITDGPYAGKKEIELLNELFKLTSAESNVLDTHVRNANNLDILLNSDVTPSTAEWTQIGDEEHCFSGNLHGNGYSINGLDKSLFYSLCGNVYNLGVTGSFTGAGIADHSVAGDTNDATVQNCWLNTTGTIAADTKAFFNYTDDGKQHIYNSYYPTGLAYAATEGAVAKPIKTFRNGEVAFNLNGYYLAKRYADHEKATDGTAYTYVVQDGNGDITKDDFFENVLHTGKYGSLDSRYVGYVEKFFEGGDYQFAGGYIPRNADGKFVEDERMVNAANQTRIYPPLWPDDYQFFGQTLNHGYRTDDEPVHNEWPHNITRTKKHTEKTRTANVIVGKHTAMVDGEETEEYDYQDKTFTIFESRRVLYDDVKSANEEENLFTNVVYRAAGYDRNAQAKPVFFNAKAVFADHENGDADKPVHHNLTAVDLTGITETNWTDGASQAAFYYPLPSLTKLKSFRAEGLTRNLLVYAPADEGEANYGKHNQEVLTNYFKDLDMAPYYDQGTDQTSYDDGKKYGRVNQLVPSETYNATNNTVNGHVVVAKAKTEADNSTTYSYTTLSDHFLVPGEDFFAPITYNMGEGHRMWYQHAPADMKYVDASKGWMAISLPFAVDITSTQDKGEITHFYKKNASGYNQKYDSGHEYWLRGFNGAKEVTEGSEKVTMADMQYPDAVTVDGVINKKDDNTFLWDYYYSKSAQQDKNNDVYQTYYKDARTYADYGFAQANTPYIVGFPGSRYYEFDMSGQWTPSNTGHDADWSHSDDGDVVANLGAQVVTYASAEGSQIPASNMTGVTKDGYTFVPNFLNDTEGKNATVYVLNADGSAFEQVTTELGSEAETPAEGKIVLKPFQPYFKAVPSNNVHARRIVFGMDNKSQLGDDEKKEKLDNVQRGLNVTTKRGRIIVSSSLDVDRSITIVSFGGQVFDSYTICPGEKVETAVAPGAYIVAGQKIMVK